MDSTYDVVVAGGGPAGINAAIAAARLGAKTLLVEKHGFLGGMSTAAMVYPWMTFHTADGKQVIKGIAQEIVDELVKRDASPGHVRDTIGFVYSVTPYRAEVYAVLAAEMVMEAGSDLLLHSFIDEVSVEGNQITELSISGKSGRKRIRSSMFIDCTGDADLAYLAGADFQYGREQDRLTQPMTMKFRMRGVNLEEVKRYMVDHRDQFYEKTLFDDLEHKGIPLTAVQGFYPQWKEADLPINRDQVLFFTGPAEDEVLINCSRVQGLDGTRTEDLTTAEIEGRKQVLMLAEFLRDYVPGFKNAEVSAVGTQIGVRETRRLAGRYVLDKADIVSGRRFPDTIARSGYPIDIHDPAEKNVTVAFVEGDGAFDIPYRCLLPIGIDNLLAAGRCISTTHEAFATTRLTPSAMATGQAAGAAAALAVKQKMAPHELDIEILQAQLVQDGVVIQ